MSTFSREALAAAVLVAAVSGVTHASTVTFAPLTNVNQGLAGDGTTYLEGGLTFTSSVSGRLSHWGTSQSFNADPPGATLFLSSSGTWLTVSKTGGGGFFLGSFDLADIYNTGAGSVIPFSYTDGSGTFSSTLTLDNAIGLQTFVFGYAGVTSFSLRQDNPFFQIDNIVTDAVPEPRTYALMMAGLLAVVGAVRRRGGRAHS